jgi:hypothetical protein
MYNKTVFIFIAFILFSSFVNSGERRPNYEGICELNNTSFASGEKLVFKAYYNWQFVWIPAGEAVFTIKENKFDYEIKVTGKTYTSYEDFFKVNDYFYSRIDKKTMYPKNFVRIIEEGNYRKFDSIVFDQVNEKAFSINGKSRKVATRKEINYKSCMHDLLSVLYFLRNVDVDGFKKGDFIPTQVLLDSGTYPIKVRYQGKEPKKSIKELGTFKTIKVIPDLVVGEVFKEGNKMQVWVSDDANKVPLFIESPLKIGSAKVVLKSYTGLRNPLTSKIK